MKSVAAFLFLCLVFGVAGFGLARSHTDQSPPSKGTTAVVQQFTSHVLQLHEDPAHFVNGRFPLGADFAVCLTHLVSLATSRLIEVDKHLAEHAALKVVPAELRK